MHSMDDSSLNIFVRILSIVTTFAGIVVSASVPSIFSIIDVELKQVIAVNAVGLTLEFVARLILP